MQLENDGVSAFNELSNLNVTLSCCARFYVIKLIERSTPLVVCTSLKLFVIDEVNVGAVSD